MARLLTGREAAAALTAELRERAAALALRNVTPRLAILRCGENEADGAYLRGALKRGALCGVDVAVRTLPEKDVDGMTDISASGVYLGRDQGFAPCTAEAVTVMLDYYHIDCAGKRAVVIGRSPVVGRPAAMLLLARNATVTVCHTGTVDLPAVTRTADIIVTAAGAAGSLTAAHVRPGQTVIDVSVNWDAARNAMVGDADAGAASVVAAITPVPGGVGAVTSTVLMRHVLRAAERGTEGGCL